MSYTIAEPHVTKSAGLYTNERPIIEFIIKPNAIKYKTKKEAITAYMKDLDKDLENASYAFILTHWKVHQRNGCAKCVKIK